MSSLPGPVWADSRVRFDQPYVVPIHLSLDAERSCVYAFSTVGQKILWMRENPQVCLEVEEIRDKETGRLCWRSGGTRRSTRIRRKPRLDAAPSSCSCSAETGGCRRLGGLRAVNTRTWSSTAFRLIDLRVPFHARTRLTRAAGPWRGKSRTRGDVYARQLRLDHRNHRLAWEAGDVFSGTAFAFGLPGAV